MAKNCRGVESRADNKYQGFTYEHRSPCAPADLHALRIILKRSIVWVILECDDLPCFLDKLLDVRIVRISHLEVGIRK